MKRFLRSLVFFLILVVILWFVPTTRAFLARTLFDVARSPAMGNMVGWGFEYVSPLLPVKRVLLTDKMIAFHHPRPNWSNHILIIPRKQVTTMFDLLENKEYLESVYKAAHDIFLSQGFDASKYALLVNGGIRQDVKQVHFHLHQEKDKLLVLQDVLESSVILETSHLKVYELRDKSPLHLALVPTFQLSPLSTWQEADVKQLARLELPLAELEQRYHLRARGFSLIFQEGSDFERQQLVIHLTAGRLN